MAEHEDLVVEVAVGHGEAVAGRRRPVQPGVAEPNGEVERNHLSSVLHRSGDSRRGAGPPFSATTTSDGYAAGAPGGCTWRSPAARRRCRRTRRPSPAA